MNRLYNKNTPLEKGVKISYRKYLIFSCLCAFLLMVLLAVAYSDLQNDWKRTVFIFAESALAIIYSIPINKMKDRELLEHKDERGALNHLKTVQTIAYIAFGAIFIFMILSIRNMIPTLTISLLLLLVGFIFLLYAVIFCLYEKKGT